VYSYCEISQNNNYSTGYRGFEHWRQIQRWRGMIDKALGPRPFNNEKIYGSTGPARPSVGEERDALERFWRIVFGGCASARFHRPESGWGLGLTEPAQRAIRTARQLEERFPIVESAPAPGRIVESGSPEAYCLEHASGACAVYLPQGGVIRIDAGPAGTDAAVHWLEPVSGSWVEAEASKTNEGFVLEPLSQGPAIGVVRSGV
jgi:hypothetical protein